MFEVIFEVNPHSSQWDAYLTIAKSLKPELEQIRGFIDNVRWKSLTRPGWLLSLSDWEDEKALVRWRTVMKHHHAQEKGRDQVFNDYHLRIGEVFSDSNKEGFPVQMRLDTTEVGETKVVTLFTTTMDANAAESDINTALKLFGFDQSSSHRGLVGWDVYEAILFPGKHLLACSWVDLEAAESSSAMIDGSFIERTRHVRIVRDYGMFDRREAPQYYPDVERHSDGA